MISNIFKYFGINVFDTFFIIFRVIWAFADAVFVPIISSLLGLEKNSSECVVGIILGLITEFFFGPVIAFTLEKKASSWIANIYLIVL